MIKTKDNNLVKFNEWIQRELDDVVTTSPLMEANHRRFCARAHCGCLENCLRSFLPQFAPSGSSFNPCFGKKMSREERLILHGLENQDYLTNTKIKANSPVSWQAVFASGLSKRKESE